jgi:ABC-type uncharacterized transport system fused permease/ATPase subunit
MSEFQLFSDIAAFCLRIKEFNRAEQTRNDSMKAKELAALRTQQTKAEEDNGIAVGKVTIEKRQCLLILS